MKWADFLVALGLHKPVKFVEPETVAPLEKCYCGGEHAKDEPHADYGVPLPLGSLSWNQIKGNPFEVAGKSMLANKEALEKLAALMEKFEMHATGPLTKTVPVGKEGTSLYETYKALYGGSPSAFKDWYTSEFQTTTLDSSGNKIPNGAYCAACNHMTHHKFFDPAGKPTYRCLECDCKVRPPSKLPKHMT